ncbi:hypothetical protein DFR74_1043 [Nocardia puris]|uniref:Uncharacterized protein n=1 Tax=Nocardia puris TaxID=208602 RepID=A0A366DML0_9NOCA|nr:hypothetical protein DFR74_1043 [Nocardia puris]
MNESVKLDKLPHLPAMNSLFAAIESAEMGRPAEVVEGHRRVFRRVAARLDSDSQRAMAIAVRNHYAARPVQ